MDHSTIEAFAEAFANAPRLAEMEVRSPSQGILRFRRSLQSAEKKPRPATKNVASATKIADAPSAIVPPVNTNTIVTSTLVGIFRVSPKAPVSIGSHIQVGQTIGMIEVMRLSDEIIAPVSGEIVAIFVQDAQPVEYGQPLFEIIADKGEEGQANDA